MKEINRIKSVLLSGQADITDSITSLGYQFAESTPFGGALYTKGNHKILFTVYAGTVSGITYMNDVSNSRIDLVRDGKKAF